METWIDEATREVGDLRDFILPGGSPAAAALHLARTVCRRAERTAVALRAEEPVEADVVRYLNRLSDLLFTLARLENAKAGIADVVWKKDA
jgi:cob(I)alamin adenosyltransferase